MTSMLYHSTLPKSECICLILATYSAHRPHLQASPVYKQTACELRESSNSKLKCHTQQAALAVEALLEAGSTFDVMDQFYNGESLMQCSDSSDGNMDTDTDTDMDTDMGSNSNEGRYSVESRLLSAYARLQLQNSSSKHRSDQWTREARYTNMHDSWHLQLPALTNAYLTWKHNSLLNVAQTSAHKFQVTAVHVFELDYFHDITQQHEEVANVSLLHVGLLGCSPTAPTVAISLQCLELYHQLRRWQSSFSIQAFTKVLCTIHNHSNQSLVFGLKWTWHSAAQILTGAFDMVVCHACLSLKAMDGNNSAKHMANAGSADLCIFPSRYMIPLDQVDMFKDDIQLHPGEHGADQLTFCTDNWKAANSTEENTVHVFEQTDIFLSACQHGIIQMVTEMRRSGEL
ncbi:hypothetical protein BDR04DRAFT_1122967 [Suillus decipiens]|nr:hypothetical protein BDR04DRAFT_1122967 [Suillus decipiens]